MGIVGYTFKGENYTPAGIIVAINASEEYDGWALGDGIHMDTESNLNEIAYHFGIDREEEWSFDSDNFPKVIDSEMVECGTSFRDENGRYVDAHGNYVD